MEALSKPLTANDSQLLKEPGSDVSSRKMEGRAGTDTAQQLGNDIEDAVKHVRFASQHRGNGNAWRIELSTEI